MLRAPGTAYVASIDVESAIDSLLSRRPTTRPATRAAPAMKGHTPCSVGVSEDAASTRAVLRDAAEISLLALCPKRAMKAPSASTASAVYVEVLPPQALISRPTSASRNAILFHIGGCVDRSSSRPMKGSVNAYMNSVLSLLFSMYDLP